MRASQLVDVLKCIDIQDLCAPLLVHYVMLCNTQDPPLHFASFGAEGVLATASVEGHVVKVWPPMTPQAGLPVQPQARLEVGVSTKDTPQPGIIHRSAIDTISLTVECIRVQELCMKFVDVGTSV